MARTQKQDWDVRTNLGASPGSQGTLFSGGKSQMSDARYPRGYTPERQSAVAEAVIRPTIVHVAGERQEIRGTQSWNFKDRKVRASGDMSAPMVNQSNDSNRRLVDNIARSTVPVEHLQGVQFRTNVSPQQLGHPTTAGHYDSRGDALTVGGPVIRLRQGAESTSVTLHEIGHHVSNVQGNEWVPHYSYESHEGGREEAFADDYAETHHRDRSGRQVDRGIYGGGQFAGRIERGAEFWRGYAKHRGYAVSHAADVASNEIHYSRYPEDRVHKDGSQDVPLINKSFVSQDDKKSKPELDINWEAQP